MQLLLYIQYYILSNQILYPNQLENGLSWPLLGKDTSNFTFLVSEARAGAAGGPARLQNAVQLPISHFHATFQGLGPQLSNG
jgi:hypothetical protein